ncbi:MAG: endonuclease III [Candidatus Paceibacterota bacterium]|jgi:endonuclease-3
MKSQSENIRQIISILEKDYPDYDTELNFKTPHQLLVAVILSAQCTDKRVNLVTNSLFDKYKDVKAFADANLKEFEQDIYSTGFYRNKAKNIIAASRMIVEKFDSKVPDSMEDLITLPGVARKTANVVLSEVFDKQSGIAVDTHVIRLSNLLGLTGSKDPKVIEKELMSVTERKEWGKVSNLLILHGRNICVARRPKCNLCSIREFCPFFLE